MFVNRCRQCKRRPARACTKGRRCPVCFLNLFPWRAARPDRMPAPLPANGITARTGPVAETLEASIVCNGAAGFVARGRIDCAMQCV
ncbi:hypothetical protein BN2476_720045 [Paraburkholderia piptadeniae]|uniref:Uncharacterized protein n=1 Tax=Paraburkholderia piptadeniae TaxID=1701573 RepID=A0A1N7SR81_9BURK|nr:hypothetical protein BN2476_720045 [Paraburkholderia piptadeniae]